MSIPLIGQRQQQPEVAVEMSVVPPVLIMRQGMISVQLPLNDVGLARQIRMGLDEIIRRAEPPAEISLATFDATGRQTG